MVGGVNSATSSGVFRWAIGLVLLALWLGWPQSAEAITECHHITAVQTGGNGQVRLEWPAGNCGVQEKAPGTSTWVNVNTSGYQLDPATNRRFIYVNRSAGAWEFQAKLCFYHYGLLFYCSTSIAPLTIIGTPALPTNLNPPGTSSNGTYGVPWSHAGGSGIKYRVHRRLNSGNWCYTPRE